ncbi:MAG TPA: GNAT family N-acetyltransferase [Fimbriiglobus sp.]|nr:GNAT family N-acetyltransferase [Fimbriiglobus sp.]
MTLSIRRATSADEEVIARYNAALARESEGKMLDDAVLLRGVRAVLADPAKGFYTIAERGGEPVGQAMVTFEWSDWRDGWYWWVQSVYVRADARRGGVFRALFEHLKAQAMADPTVIGLRLYVERDNLRAQQTYTALGMSEEPYFLMGLYPLPGRGSALAMANPER